MISLQKVQGKYCLLWSCAPGSARTAYHLSGERGVASTLYSILELQCSGFGAGPTTDFYCVQAHLHTGASAHGRFYTGSLPELYRGP